MGIKRTLPSFRDVLIANRRAEEHLALMAGKPLRPMVGGIPDAPKTRAAAGSSGEPLEKDIQKEIMAYLKTHPRVAFRGRFNRGTMQSQYGDKASYTMFNTVVGFSDIHGMLKGGAAFYIEVKRRTGRAEPEQQAFIDHVWENGGIAFVARSVEDVKKFI